MTIQQKPFGTTPAGQAVELFTLSNSAGLVAKVTNFGGILTSLQTPDRDGNLGEITLGFDNLAGYLGEHPYFGATIGRFGNRIVDGKFNMNGQLFCLAKNENGINHLHGGEIGFDKVVWTAKPIESDSNSGVELSYLSVDGEEGYPGNLSVRVTYSLTDENELRIDYSAQTDKPTPINLTNHTYFNLADAGKGDALGHILSLNADRFLPINEKLNPTGSLASVADTPMDFRKPMVIGQRIADVPGGYDHCYVINRPDNEALGARKLQPTAKVFEPTSGRLMEILTTEPGVQLYTGNYLDGLAGRSGTKYQQHHGFCLETQHFPDSPNQPGFPETILQPGQTYTHSTIHRFATE